MMDDSIRISEWDANHRRWSEVVQFFDEHQGGLPDVIYDDQCDSRILVACTQRKIVGVLRLIVIPIGPDDGLPPVKIDNKELLQAKVMKFFVLPEFRRRRIGRRLQEAAISLARSLSCYQLASFSSSENRANHMLKLRMGFAVQPEFRQNRQAHGLKFIMPLQTEFVKIDDAE